MVSADGRANDRVQWVRESVDEGGAAYSVLVIGGGRVRKQFLPKARKRI
ncbi:hypothetical protein KCP74_00870 [Salmonella enterica subsp. enterica]|nr:hypothetical protein KCP74_00870 [Salmonella enterica subsp. enterica]